MMTHTFLTVAFPIDPKFATTINQALDEMGNPAETAERRESFRGKGIHFMSMTVLAEPEDRTAHFILEASVDGSLEEAQSVVCSVIGNKISELLQIAGSVISEVGFPSLLKQHTHVASQALFGTPGLNFTGSPGMTVERITQEYNLSRMVRDFFDARKPCMDYESSLQILDDIRRKVENLVRAQVQQPEIDPKHRVSDRMLIAEAVPFLSNPLSSLDRAGQFGRIATKGIIRFLWPVGALATLALVAVLFVAIQQQGWGWGLLAGFVFVLFETLSLAACAWLVYRHLRHLENSDFVNDTPPDPLVLEAVMNRENKTSQNHMFGVSVMKVGMLRNLALRVVFWVIGQHASSISCPGYLGEVGTIHFARWILLPGTNKLLFFSNYGGSWESYLEDFITKASVGLTGVWSNTQGFPRTTNIFQDGATDSDRFKRWARRQMRPARFWYSAYPHLTTERIRINAAIRHGLATIKTEDQAAIWLSCIGSRPRQSHTLETADIQQIVFGGLRSLPHAKCLLIRLPNTSDSAQLWLRSIEGEISFGDQSPGESSRLLAVSATGLSKLGLTQQQLLEFPIAFQQGMSAKHRSQFLGDTGDDKPEKWLWGHGRSAVDVVITLYHRTSSGLESDVEQQLERLRILAGEVIHQIDLQTIDLDRPTREPFGFVDGISQPIIKGSRNWAGDSDPLHVVDAGEIIMGYPDNRGFVPRSPTVPPMADPRFALPALERVIAVGAVPVFNADSATCLRDLGRNGTYLVIRQLEQDVAAFNRFIDNASEELTNRPSVPNANDPAKIAQWIAAKMVGRWKDGTSLVRNPEKPGGGWGGDGGANLSIPDNSFQMGTEDPQGLRCPFGAHIRRTNPRDSLTPGSQDQLDITNRHRILRVGRPYLPQVGSVNPGLLFMCLNTDIERQFEFIQQTWAMEKSFHGLDGEVDSIIGRGGEGGRLTIPRPNGPILLKGLKDFVKVLGGGYFFLPSRRAVRFLGDSKAKNSNPSADRTISGS